MEVATVLSGKIKYQVQPSLNQIYNKGLEYVILDQELNALTPRVLCKDYFQEMIKTELDGKDSAIFGFSHKKTGKVLNSDRLIIGLSYTKDDLKLIDYKDNLQRFINQIEDITGYVKTEVIQKEDTLLVFTSIEWTRVPYLWSFYLLCLRSGLSYIESYKTPKEFFNDKKLDLIVYNSNKMSDRHYMDSALNKIDMILEEEYLEQTYEEYGSDTYSMHNNSGIVNIKDENRNKLSFK